jgi:hypothetical protein
MRPSLNDKILRAIDTLEALYFLTESLEVHQERIQMIRREFRRLPKDERKELLDEGQAEVADIRGQSGAIAPNTTFRRLLADARRQPGLAYLPKIFIDAKLFRHYDKVFRRWPHVKHHALVIFDGQTNRATHQFFELEGALFGDARLLLDRCREAHKNVSNFRKRHPEDQRNLHSYLRSLTTVIFHFIEAYLNGLPYDCFQVYHDSLSIADHDLLAEWNSKEKRTKYVPLEKKIFRYPVVVAKAEGKSINLSGSKAAHLLASEANSFGMR